MLQLPAGDLGIEAGWWLVESSVWLMLIARTRPVLNGVPSRQLTDHYENKERLNDIDSSGGK
jgi:hypothetical protein